MRDFKIDIYRLKLGEHQFKYKIDDAFFGKFQPSEVSQGTLNAEISINKKERLLECWFNITGKLSLICDRSLDRFDYPIAISKLIIFKYGDETKELSDELILISRNQQILELSQYVYEFIALSIPMKKLHPRFEGEHSEDALIYSSNDQVKLEETNDMDPRWEALKKLKKN